MKQRQTGFTLIELVIVIVILGVLAATALPRFSDLSVDASVAALNGMAGGLRSSAVIARATQLARGFTTGQAITLDGIAIAMSGGFPLASTISQTLVDFSGFTAQAVGTSVEYRLSNQARCKVSYVTGVGSTPGFAVTVTSTGVDGC